MFNKKLCNALLFSIPANVLGCSILILCICGYQLEFQICSKRSYNDSAENNCCKHVLWNIKKHSAEQIQNGRDLALYEQKVHTYSYFEKTNSFLFK